ncbi:MAG: response regulator [Saprospiraceae bacterium]
MSKVILIEDDPLDAALAIRNLRKGGMQEEIVHLSDGQEFLTYLKEDPARLKNASLVMLDLKMPRFSGFDVLQAMKDDNLLGHFPIVVFSSSRDRGDVERAYALGCNAYVLKPISPTEYRSTIMQIQDFWLRTNILPAA